MVLSLKYVNLDKVFKQKVVDMYVVGKKCMSTISKEVGIDSRMVSRILSEFNIKKDLAYSKYSIELMAEIILKYKNGEDIWQLSKKYEVYGNTIRYWLRCRGIQLRGNITSPQQLYTYNRNYFDHIDTEGKAYFLGMMYADGCVSTKNISILALHKDDIDVIEKFCVELESDLPIKRYKNIKRRNMAILSICSTQLSQDLIKQGCMVAKTFKLKFPKKLDDDLKHHFIRGYFDGDGCVGKYHYKHDYYIWNILGTHQFTTGCREFMDTQLKLGGCIYKKATVWALAFASKRDVFKIIKWLYDGATIYMDRKYKSCMEIVEGCEF